MKSAKAQDVDPTPLDEAARAAWLSYVGGKTQDQIAKDMGISRQRVQRLVSRAVAEGLIHVRLEHRLSNCLSLEAELIRKFGLRLARVAPSLGPGADPMRSVAPIAAQELERILDTETPLTLAVGTGRSLRAAIEELRNMDCRHHRVVSLIGNIALDGSATFFDVIMRVAEKIQATHYPMPLPVLASSEEERAALHALAPVAQSRELAKRADVAFVGIGQMNDSAPLMTDGFLSPEEMEQLQAQGATGEIASWIYDASGKYMDLDL
ncbi:MAG: sugar-binding transcriptional regulator, partial [Mangrovicoccus sp.]